MSREPPTSQAPHSISALKKRIKSFGRHPFHVKEVGREGTHLQTRTDRDKAEQEPPTESRLCETCSKVKLEVNRFVVRREEVHNVPDLSRTGGVAVDSVTQPESKKAAAQQLQRKQNHGNAPLRLGRISAISARQYCPFCRLVFEIIDRPLDQRAPSRSYNESANVFAKWVIDGQEEVFVDSAGSEQQFVPRTRRILIYSEPQTFKDGYIALLNDSAPFPEFFGRRLKSHDLLDADVLTSWMRTCEDTHGQECEASLVPPELMKKRKNTNVLRAIDVERWCVTDIPEDARFVALSYLWGKDFKQLFTTSENLPRLSTPGALKHEKLPRTVKDCIKLTAKIGEKYLWTDSLALVHDEGFQYHDDWIYARAHLTVVAGSGKDANAGLPGVREKSRQWHQKIEEVLPGIRLMVTHLAEDYIATSQWDSRAWTFQERMLSRRCLLFVNGRVYFQCRRSTFCEDMEMPSPKGWSLDSIDMPTRIFREKPFVQFTSAVELYTRRELTNQVDILEAFEGVKQVLEKRLNIVIYQGLFEQMMDSSLIWESTKRLVRRPGFPSWSWAGWRGEIQWKFSDSARSWIQWHRSEDGEDNHNFPAQLVSRIEPPIPWQKHKKLIARKLSNASDNTLSPLLHFDTVVAQFQLMYPQSLQKAIVSPLRKRLTGPSALATVRPAPVDPGVLRTGIADREGLWCGTIDLDVRWTSKTMAPLKFLIMSRNSRFAEEELEIWKDLTFFPDYAEEEVKKFDYGVYNVMLVSEARGIYYREGLGRILACALEKSIEPACWQDVLLG